MAKVVAFSPDPDLHAEIAAYAKSQERAINWMYRHLAEKQWQQIRSGKKGRQLQLAGTPTLSAANRPHGRPRKQASDTPQTYVPRTYK